VAPSEDSVVGISANPILSRGIASVLHEAGLRVHIAAEADDWATIPDIRVAIVELSATYGRALIGNLSCPRSVVSIVAVVDAAIPGAYVEALQAGACSAVFREGPPEELIDSVRAALRGHSLLPVGVIRCLVSLLVSGSSRSLSSLDAQMLHALAQGDSVVALAARLGYSEREMHRKLRKLYSRIGAANRAHAIVLATRWDLVAAEDEDRVVLRLSNQG
jgi:DNA-binding NarL/FixJ family response regulator